MSQVVKKPSLFPTFPTFFDDFFTKDFFDWNDKNFAKVGSTLPSVNLKETDKEYHIELAAPGMKMYKKTKFLLSTKMAYSI